MQPPVSMSLLATPVFLVGFDRGGISHTLKIFGHYWSQDFIKLDNDITLPRNLLLKTSDSESIDFIHWSINYFDDESSFS
jgi:hypothetical protein